MPERRRRVLVAGIGNTWMADDGFGAHVAKRLAERGVPEQVTVFDFGTGGLDLAYEVMQGYDALVLVDTAREGGEAGALYLIEPDPDEIKPIEDGEVVSPHGMDPKTVLRFVKTVNGWPGKVVVVACEPSAGEGMGLELSAAVAGSVDRAADLVLETVANLLTDEGYQDEAMSEQASG